MERRCENWLNTIGKILGRELKIEIESARVRPETSEVMRLVSDNRKASTMMGWKPKVDLETGLAATVQHIQKHPEFYKDRGYVV